MKKNYILILLVLAFACRKNGDGYHEDFPSVYNAMEWRSGPIRVFTQKGEIKNADTIAWYIQRHQHEFEFFHGTQAANPWFVIQMHRPDSVRFFDNGRPYLCSLSGSGNDRILTCTDTISWYLSGGSYNNETYFMQIRNAFSTYIPPYETLSTEGYPPENAFPKYSVIPVIYARRANENLEIPYIYHTLFRTSRVYRTEYFFNKLNEKGYTALQGKDTLVIQERILIAKK